MSRTPDILSTARKLLAAHGELRPQPASDWIGTFPLPPALAEFYQAVGPAELTIDAYGNPYVLPSLADLWEYQAGYRWNGLNGEPMPEWKDNWIVVAGDGGAAFIFDRDSSKVLYAPHGEDG